MKNVVSYFENQVIENPDKIAIECKNSSITYLKLNEESNKFANCLIELKIQRDETVALLLNRSIGMMATIFGILKAGAAYLPININNPINRIGDILNDSKSKVLVTESKFKAVALEIFYNSHFLEKVIFIDDGLNSEVDYTNNKNLWNFVSTKDNLIESSGWVNSYNNKPFESLEINELVNNVITKISDNLKRDYIVFEIGSGSGLIAKEVAPKVKKYVCSDISEIILEKSKLTGTILEALIFMRLLIWDGADHIVIFFNHKLSSKLLKATTLIVCSAIQMSIWTMLYVYGYNNFLELFEKLF